MVETLVLNHSSLGTNDYMDQCFSNLTTLMSGLQLPELELSFSRFCLENSGLKSTYDFRVVSSDVPDCFTSPMVPVTY